jgi:hypothetical protein
VVSEIPDLKLPPPFLHWVRCALVGTLVTAALAFPVALCASIALAGFFDSGFQSVSAWEITKRVAWGTLRGITGFFLFYPLAAYSLVGLFAYLVHRLKRYWDTLGPQAGGKM